MGFLDKLKEIDKKNQEDLAKIGITSIRMPWQKACPKCDSTKIKQVKPSLWRKAEAASFFYISGKPRTLNVCRSCGFDWEDR